MFHFQLRTFYTTDNNCMLMVFLYIKKRIISYAFQSHSQMHNCKISSIVKNYSFNKRKNKKLHIKSKVIPFTSFKNQTLAEKQQEIAFADIDKCLIFPTMVGAYFTQNGSLIFFSNFLSNRVQFCVHLQFNFFFIFFIFIVEF